VLQIECVSGWINSVQTVAHLICKATYTFLIIVKKDSRIKNSLFYVILFLVTHHMTPSNAALYKFHLKIRIGAGREQLSGTTKV
ncbi:MAG: hypothetical protein QHH75_15155, partial [Bacillota bacterium]|nr:hypothetical protein [Bacillota bacterium]